MRKCEKCEGSPMIERLKLKEYWPSMFVSIVITLLPSSKSQKRNNAESFESTASSFNSQSSFQFYFSLLIFLPSLRVVFFIFSSLENESLLDYRSLEWLELSQQVCNIYKRCWALSSNRCVPLETCPNVRISSCVVFLSFSFSLLCRELDVGRRTFRTTMQWLCDKQRRRFNEIHKVHEHINEIHQQSKRKLLVSLTFSFALFSCFTIWPIARFSISAQILCNSRF